MGVERGVRKWEGEHEELGRSSWMKNREGEKRETLKEGDIMGLERNQAIEKFPEIHKDDSS